MVLPTKDNSSRLSIWPTFGSYLPFSYVKITDTVWELQSKNHPWTPISTQEETKFQALEHKETAFFKSNKSWSLPRNMPSKKGLFLLNSFAIDIMVTQCQIQEQHTGADKKFLIIGKQTIASWNSNFLQPKINS